MVFQKIANRKNCSFKNERKKLTVNRRLAKILTVKKILAAKPLQELLWDPLNSAWSDMWVAPFHIDSGSEIGHLYSHGNSNPEGNIPKD